MSEPETPAPEQVTVDPNTPAPTAPELDVSEPAPTPEAAPLAPEPAPPAPDAVTVVENQNAGVLTELLAELRELKAKIVAAIGS